MKVSMHTAQVVLLVAMCGCDRSSSPSVSADTVHAYCDPLAKTFEHFRWFAERGDYDDLYTYWIGGSQSAFSNVGMQFHFCNDALVRDLANNSDAWIAMSEEYGKEIAMPAIDALARLRLGEGSDQDREDILKLLDRARALAEQIARGGAPAEDAK